MNDRILMQLIDDYFWNNETHKYDCPEGFLIAINKFVKSEVSE